MTKKLNEKQKARNFLIDMYIESLKEDEIPWRMGWSDGSKLFNPISDKEYHGVNILTLMAVSRKEGYEDPRWCTFKQASDKGWHIKKGAKGTPVEYWMPYDTENRKWLTWSEFRDLDMDEKEKCSLFCKTSYVFNAQQIEGIPEYQQEWNEWINPAPFVDRLIDNMGVDYLEAGDSAYYKPSHDRVVIPVRETFYDDYSYNSVRLHELCHATGHPSRLNRNILNPFGGEEYAKEELRAEISASFISQDIGLPVSDANLDNHKAYIQSWIKILENNPEELFKAIKDAEAIEKYALEIGEWDKVYEEELRLQNEKLINYMGKIMTDYYRLATQSVEPCWFCEKDDIKKYSKAEIEEFLDNKETLRTKYPDIDQIIECSGSADEMLSSQTPIIFYGDFIRIFDEYQFEEEQSESMELA